MKKIFVSCIIFIISLYQVAFSQSMIDGYFAGKNNGSIALSGSFESYDTFVLGNGSEQAYPSDYKTNTIGLFSKYGITNKIDVVASIPYVMVNTTSFADSAGNVEDVSRRNFQDAAIYLKYKAFEVNNENINFTIAPAIGFMTPLSNYTIDFYGLGQGATAVDFKIIVQAKLNNGFFGEIQGGYTLRFDPAPSYIPFMLKVGYGSEKIYADVWFGIQSAIDGNDLPISDNEDFKGLGVSYNKFGGTICYNLSNAFSICLGGSTTLSGTNLGLSNRISASIVYKF